MIPHTPEPWKWHAQGEANEYCMLTHDDRWVIAFRQNGELTDERQKANARRIAVCVNACKGIPNEQLEMDSAAFIDVFNEYNALKRQKRALLAALNLIETDKDGDGWLSRHGDGWQLRHGDGWRERRNSHPMVGQQSPAIPHQDRVCRRGWH